MSLVKWSLFPLLITQVAVGEPILDLDIKGNERTQTIYLQRMVKECIEHQENERPEGPWSADALRQCVMNSRLFSEVSVTIKQPRIDLIVEEKWTLIPIPAVTAGSGKTRRAGLFLLESNFLGLGMNLAVGGSVSNSGNSYFGFISDPSLFFTNWNYSISASRQVEDIELIEGSNEGRDGFKENALAFSGSLGYKWKRWTLSSSASQQKRKFSVLEAFEAPEDNTSTRGAVTLAYEARDYKLYFSEGFSLKLNTQQELQRTDKLERLKQYEAQISWQSAVFRDHALQLLAIGGMVAHGSKADALRLGGGRGLRGIEPKTAWAGRFYAAAIDYQIPLKSYAAGTVTMAPFADGGRIEHRGGEGDTVDYYVVGGGVYFFLKNIALPGLGLEAGYNSRYMKDFFTFSAGLSL